MLDISKRKAALVAGYSIISMAIIAGFSYGFVLTSLITPKGIEVTIHSIGASSILFRAGICGFIVILMCDILAAWALYIFFEAQNKLVSLLAAWVRLIYSALLGVVIINLIFVALLVSGQMESEQEQLTFINHQDLHAMVNLFLTGFETTFAFSLIIFAFHLFLLSYLTFDSTSIPIVISFLLTIAGLCYLISNFAHILLPNYVIFKETIDSIISLPMIIGELGFGIWLIWKGGK